MKPWLRWSLFATLGLSAWAILFPDESLRAPSRASIPSVPLPADLAGHAMAATPAPVSPASSEVASVSLPSELPQPQLEAAIADPFVGVQPVPPPAPVAAVAPLPPPAPAPTPPVLNYRFLGRVVDPDGKLQVYLSHADKEQLVAQGTQLAEGYVVQAISATSIELYYPPLDYHTQIRIPPDGAP